MPEVTLNSEQYIFIKGEFQIELSVKKCNLNKIFEVVYVGKKNVFGIRFKPIESSIVFVAKSRIDIYVCSFQEYNDNRPQPVLSIDPENALMISCHKIDRYDIKTIDMLVEKEAELRKKNKSYTETFAQIGEEIEKLTDEENRLNKESEKAAEQLKKEKAVYETIQKELRIEEFVKEFDICSSNKKDDLKQLADHLKDAMNEFNKEDTLKQLTDYFNDVQNGSNLSAFQNIIIEASAQYKDDNNVSKSLFEVEELVQIIKDNIKKRDELINKLAEQLPTLIEQRKKHREQVINKIISGD